MQRQLIIGIDLGGTNLKLALLDFKYHILKKRVLSTARFRKKENLISAIIESINNIIQDECFKKNNILGIGLGLPGPIDLQRGLVHYFPNIPGWKEVRLKQILQKKLRLPVFLDNDANLMALAEHRLGAAKGLSNVLCLTLGTGVGGGLILEGGLYRGASYAAGEIGHVPLNEAGPKCNCGGSACLESYIGNNRIMRAASRVFKKNLTLEELSRLAKKGNRQAEALWIEVGAHLGVALAGVVNLFNPDAIVIGGGVANAGKILFAKIKAVIKSRAMTVQARHVKIFKAKLGNDAGIIGAAILVRKEIKR